jgi:hypothetical protein
MPEGRVPKTLETSLAPHRRQWMIQQSANVTLHGCDNSFHQAEEARWRWLILQQTKGYQQK